MESLENKNDKYLEQINAMKQESEGLQSQIIELYNKLNSKEKLHDQ